MRAISALLLPSLAAAGVAAQAPAPKPRIAIVIDDFGLTYPANVPDAKWWALPFAYTAAVMPQAPPAGKGATKRAAQEAQKAGKEVIVHFPFDPFLSLELKKEGEPSEADKRKVLKLMAKVLQDVPQAKGLNNHRSTKSTQNAPLMRWFMGELKARGFFFLDSKVSPKSVAYAEAVAAGLRAARNDTFLDEARRHDKAFCQGLLKNAAARARAKGSAVAIGHHYFHGTYECLAESVPLLQKEGFDFVVLSDVLR